MHGNCRTTLIEKLYEEIVGPGSGETIRKGMPCSLPDKETEVITDMPEKRYYIGVLFPKGDQMEVDNNATRFDIDEAKNNETEEDDTQSPDETDRCGLLASMPDLSDDTMEEVIALSTQNKPSSIGMTFIVDSNIDSVCVDVTFATYTHTTFEDCLSPYMGNLSADAIESSIFGSIVYLKEGILRLKRWVDKREITSIWEQDQTGDRALLESIYKLAAQCHKVYGFKRLPHSGSVLLPLDGTPVKNVCGIKFACLRAIKNDLSLGLRTVTIMLYNDGSGRYNGTNTIFQPKLEVKSSKNSTFHIKPYDISISADEEELSLALLYRNRVRYASGHGISVFWNIAHGEWKVYTDLMPITQVPQMDFDYALKRGIEKRILSLKFLSDLSTVSTKDKHKALESLISVYEFWIDNLKEEAKKGSLSEKFDNIAAKHIKMCEEAAARMREGIKCLLNNSDAMKAFELANRAMLMQMKHRKIVQEVPDKEEPTGTPYKRVDYSQMDIEYKEFIWRPFQAAFFLMNIRGLTDTEPLEQIEQNEYERDRDIVDIIWFPTGGGKTEAYLALTAFTIFYRYLKYPESSSGTAVLMRYTLRLLTSQQFARASTLICACDLIRKELWKNSRCCDKRWKKPITIGLWIGGDHTPNKNSSYEPLGAKECCGYLKDKGKGSIAYRNDYYNKFQVLTCPWCGASLVPSEKSNRTKENWGYRIDDRGHFYLRCVRPQCPFGSKLPVQVVDEELYRDPPTLLFATVDKFAMIAWNKDVGKFFGIYSNNRTPELIIQDELHLISGPLGSIVGLYETAIDLLCSLKGVRPKIVASTATIRRANEQCRQLYNRSVRQFPPPGIDEANSFFAKEADVFEKPGRMYVGIFPSGKTKAMLQTKVMSTLLQYVSMLDVDDTIKDQYWTLTAYFNSLRDLGKCSGLVDDDIKDFMKRLCRRIATDRIIRSIAMADELTSRVPTTTLVKRLKKLEKTTYSKENQAAKNYAINVLLATNMISVGVDVDRLNLMTVVGQPKLTSEYIQTTSRVGRKHPGLVCVLYDATKSRDRSYYEQFHAYHESFYKYVEPTSVTPFSKPSLDRALHAVLVGIVRNLNRDLLDDGDAKNFTGNYLFLEMVKKELLRRIKSIYTHVCLNERLDLNDISTQIDDFFKEWARRVEDTPSEDKLYYGLRFMLKSPGANEHRLLRPFGMWEKEQSYETLTSMRNVDQSLSARMLIWEE